MKEKHWSQKKERGTILGIKFLLACYRFLGKRFLSFVLWPVVTYFYLSSKITRKASKKYLQKVYQLKPDSLERKPDWKMGVHHYHQFALSILDKIDAWSNNIDLSLVDSKGVEHYESLIKQKKGAIFIGAHFGNMELSRALSGKNNYKRFNALVFTQHAIKFNQVLKEINPDVEINLIQVSDIGPDTAMLLKDKIDAGEHIVIVGDRTSTTVHGKVIYADFLGQKAPFPTGPFVLSALMECPIYTLFCYKKNERYNIEFEPLLSSKLVLKRSQRNQQLEMIVGAYANRLENYCLNYPLQWFNFFDFWTEQNQL